MPSKRQHVEAPEPAHVCLLCKAPHFPSLEIFEEGVAEGSDEVVVLGRDEVSENSEVVGVGSTVDVENVVSSVVLGSIIDDVVATDRVEDGDAVDDAGEQVSISAPGPEIGVKSTASIPKSVPASSAPYDVTTILTVCVSPLTVSGTPKGCHSASTNSNAPPQATLSTKIWKEVTKPGLRTDFA